MTGTCVSNVQVTLLGTTILLHSQKHTCTESKEDPFMVPHLLRT